MRFALALVPIMLTACALPAAAPLADGDPDAAREVLVGVRPADPALQLEAAAYGRVLGRLMPGGPQVPVTFALRAHEPRDPDGMVRGTLTLTFAAEPPVTRTYALGNRDMVTHWEREAGEPDLDRQVTLWGVDDAPAQVRVELYDGVAAGRPDVFRFVEPETGMEAEGELPAGKGEVTVRAPYWAPALGSPAAEPGPAWRRLSR